MPSCIICCRSRNAKSKSELITFHRFPSSNPTLMEKWIDFLVANKRSVNDLKKNSVICSCHFDSSYFKNYKSKRVLISGAVPYLNISRAKSVKESFPEIKQLCSSLDMSSSSSSVFTYDISSERIITPDDTTHLSDTPSTSVCFKSISPTFLDDIFDNNVEYDKVETPSPIATISTSAKHNANYPAVEYKTNQANHQTSSVLVASKTQSKIFYKRVIRQLSHKLAIKNKKLKVLEKKIRLHEKRILSMSDIISKLKDPNLM